MIKFVKKKRGFTEVPNRLIYKREYKPRYTEEYINKFPEVVQDILKKENEAVLNWKYNTDILYLKPRSYEEGTIEEKKLSIKS